jgi:hypothetical protein
MRPNKKPSWTEDENGRLQAMVAQGASVIRAAGGFKRSTVSVRNQARKLGTPFPPHRTARKKWAEVRQS